MCATTRAPRTRRIPNRTWRRVERSAPMPKDATAVFGMKESLVARFDKHAAGVGPNGEHVDTPFYTVQYDFVLRPAP
jgi:hydroxyquinol 1,2-dioxygenase